MEEIDDWYKQQEEKIEEEFFESVKKGKTQKEAIEIYQKRLGSLKRDYKSKYDKAIKGELKRAKNPKKKEFKIEKTKRYDVHHIDFKPTFWGRQKRFWSFFWFKFRRNSKMFFDKYFPDWMIYSFYKSKKITKDIREEVFGFFRRIYEFFYKIVASILKFIWNLIKKIFGGLKKILVGIFNWIRGKFFKKKEKKEDDSGMTEAEKKIMKDVKE